jgi:glucosamine-6-phosphate deaminase
MAEKAAEDFASAAVNHLQGRDDINVVFAGAESQQAFHWALVHRKDIEWGRINAFAVDDFLCIGMPESFSVAAQPMRDLYAHVKPKSVNRVVYNAMNAEAERARYEVLVRASPPQICCLGVGISGHVALNEPDNTDFNDPAAVRVVDICPLSKRQLEQDPNFMKLGRIPDKGITLTLSFLMKAPDILLMVPYPLKADIISAFLSINTPTTALPASILKTRDNVRLYLDKGSYPDAHEA